MSYAVEAVHLGFSVHLARANASEIALPQKLSLLTDGCFQGRNQNGVTLHKVRLPAT